MKPKALDLFSGAGGAAMGIYRAGFDVVGVDIKQQSRYPFRLVQADAFRLPFDLKSFDFIWASPPCQRFTNARVIHGNDHPDLLTPMREQLKASGVPWVIENVPGAPMRADVVLCGSLFGQPKLRRHRLFEFWKPSLMLVPPCSHGPETISVFGHGGHVYHGLEEWREIMGIDWMTRDELAQAIPPAYSEFLCRQILKQIRA